MIIFIYFIAVVVPVVFWVVFFRYLDRSEPEPPKLLFRLFRYGLVSMLVAMGVEFILEEKILGLEKYAFDFTRITDSGILISAKAFLLFSLSYFLAGPIEELIKYLFLKRLVFKNHHFNQIADGVIYGTVLALGFSFIENSLYFFDVYRNLNQDDFLFVIFTRGFATTLLHLVSTGIMGFYLGRARFVSSGKKYLIFRGVFIACLLHGVYNVAVFFDWGLKFNLALVFLAIAFLVFEFERRDSRKIRFKDVEA